MCLFNLFASSTTRIIQSLELTRGKNRKGAATPDIDQGGVTVDAYSVSRVASPAPRRKSLTRIGSSDSIHSSHSPPGACESIHNM